MPPGYIRRCGQLNISTHSMEKIPKKHESVYACTSERDRKKETLQSLIHIFSIKGWLNTKAYFPALTNSPNSEIFGLSLVTVNSTSLFKMSFF